MEPVHFIEDKKRVTFMDLKKKRMQLRYEVKKGLKLTGDVNGPVRTNKHIACCPLSTGSSTTSHLQKSPSLQKLGYFWTVQRIR
jgi:hypothetical protein